MLVNLLYARRLWLGDTFLKSMADLILTHSIFSLSYCNQHMLRTDTSVRKQLTFRESSCFLDIFTRPRESLQTFPFRSFLFYILRPCYNQLLPPKIIYTLTRVTLKSHVYAWKFSFRRTEWWMKQRLERVKSTVAFVSKNRYRFWRIGLVKWKADSAHRIFLLSSRLSADPSGCLEPAWREPRRKTADLYFFVRGAAGRPVSLHGPRAVCVPYTGCALHRSISKRVGSFQCNYMREIIEKFLRIVLSLKKQNKSETKRM